MANGLTLALCSTSKPLKDRDVLFMLFTVKGDKFGNFQNPKTQNKIKQMKTASEA